MTTNAIRQMEDRLQAIAKQQRINKAKWHLLETKIALENQGCIDDGRYKAELDKAEQALADAMTG